MAVESPIKILKNLFLKFFSDMAKPNEKKIENAYRFASSSSSSIAYSKAIRTWEEYKKKSKSLIFSYSATVKSMVGMIGQEGVDSFDAWVKIYATPSSPNELSSTAVADLKKWYDKYLKPLS